jgi:hypothetical protein
MLASATSYDVSLQSLAGICGGEECVFGAFASGKDGRDIASLIERRPQALDSSDCAGDDVWPQWGSEFDFVNVVDSIRVFLNDSGVWLAFKKQPTTSIKLSNVLLCSRNPPFRAVEAGHAHD